MKQTACLVTLCLLISLSVHAEQEAEYPEAGKPCPSFVLRNIRYYTQTQARLEDFRGKWLVLDFWNKSCGACIASFPRVSKLQQEFGKQVQFMMVGIQDQENMIEPMYAKFREKKGLAMPCAFDSALANRFDIYTAPYIIVIDPKGIVQAITYALTESDIKGFLSGNPPRLARAFRMNEEVADTRTVFDRTRPFMVAGNGGSDTAFLFRSVLARYDAFTQQGYMPATITTDSALGLFQALGVPLYFLFNYAYYGEARPGEGFHQGPVLETRDTTLFIWSSLHSTNLFSYSVRVPREKANRSYLQKTLQTDLEKYFNYKASIETRSFPCWRLIADSTAARKLRTRGGKESSGTTAMRADFWMQNMRYSTFFNSFSYLSGLDIIDGTGLSGNIDIKVSGFLDGPDVLRKSLQQYGLDLVLGQRRLQVLVIRDDQ